MTGWLVFGILVALFLCYAADRVVQARVRARRLRRITERLAAATARAEEQQVARAAEAEASAALTSVLPAIKRPPLTLPGPASRGDVPPED
jgi:type VI protein secretion system component VasK